jgi:hypothetical protein
MRNLGLGPCNDAENSPEMGYDKEGLSGMSVGDVKGARLQNIMIWYDPYILFRSFHLVLLSTVAP